MSIYSNPEGAEYDLGRDGAFSNFIILIGAFISVDLMYNPSLALKKKGNIILIIYQ
jgi:hypothetical protein